MSEAASLTKQQLHELADRLYLQEAGAIEECVAFFAAESRGCWHGRARAMMARRMKHVTLTPAQRSAVLGAIYSRLRTGNFSEQFKDQLRLAFCIDPRGATEACDEASFSSCEHVRRIAMWGQDNLVSRAA